MISNNHDNDIDVLYKKVFFTYIILLRTTFTYYVYTYMIFHINYIVIYDIRKLQSS